MIDHQLSEYEQLRLNNIRRNEELLASLGFEKPPEQTKSTPKPRGKRKNSELENNAEEQQPKRRSQRKNQTETPVSTRSTRSSPRLNENETISSTNNPSITVKGEGMVKPEPGLKSEPEFAMPSVQIDPLIDEPNRVPITAQSVVNYIQKQNPYHLNYFSNDDINHCVYRMSYMSSKKLHTRLNTIIRCLGKKALAKLLIFYYCLKCSNLESLANIAYEALEKKLNFDMIDYE